MPHIIKRRSIYEQVIEHLKTYILDNGLQPGDRLPTETVLAEQLGVSRLSVREALRVMESWGILQSKPRDGIRLKTLSMKPVTDHLSFWLDMEGVTFYQMSVARLVLEEAILPLVAENADEQDFQRMEAAIARMREHAQRNEPDIEADLDFHLALNAATKNLALQSFGTMLQEFFAKMRGHIIPLGAPLWQAISEHEQIVKALRNKDVTEAQRVIRIHLSDYLSESYYVPSKSDDGQHASIGRKAIVARREPSPNSTEQSASTTNEGR